MADWAEKGRTQILGIGTSIMPGRNARGFSLIEIMVVLVIVGLLASTVVLTLPDGKAATSEQVNRFAARVAMVAQESIVTNTTMGLAISGEGYAFYKYKDGRWSELKNDRVFGRENWNAAATISIERDGGRLTRATENAPFSPAIRFESTGLSTPFSLSFSAGDEKYRVIGDGRGHAEVKAHDES